MSQIVEDDKAKNEVKEEEENEEVLEEVPEKEGINGFFMLS